MRYAFLGTTERVVSLSVRVFGVSGHGGQLRLSHLLPGSSLGGAGAGGPPFFIPPVQSGSNSIELALELLCTWRHTVVKNHSGCLCSFIQPA